MPPPKTRYTVFISSTYEDLKRERDIVSRAIMRLDCMPIGMEAFPAADEEQLVFVKKLIDDTDYYILVVGSRYGSVDDEGKSYTEKEYEYATQKRIPILAFLSDKPDTAPSEKTDNDHEKRNRLMSFRARVSDKRLTSTWASADDLGTKVTASLSRAMTETPRPGWVRPREGTSRDTAALSNDHTDESSKIQALFESHISGVVEIKSAPIVLWKAAFLWVLGLRPVNHVSSYYEQEFRLSVAEIWRTVGCLCGTETSEDEIFDELKLRIRHRYRLGRCYIRRTTCEAIKSVLVMRELMTVNSDVKAGYGCNNWKATEFGKVALLYVPPVRDHPKQESK